MAQRKKKMCVHVIRISTSVCVYNLFFPPWLMKSTAVQVKYFSCSDILPLLALNSHSETHIIDGLAILKTWLVSKIKLPLIMKLMRWENIGLGVKMLLKV